MMTTTIGAAARGLPLDGALVFLLLLLLIAEQVVMHGTSARLLVARRALVAAIIPMALAVSLVLIRRIAAVI